MHREREGGKGNTLKPFSDCGSGDVNEITFLEDFLQDEPLVGLEPLHGRQPELLEVSQRDDFRFLEVTHLGLGELPVPDPSIPDLNRIVPVGGLGLDLGHDVALSEPYHRHRDHSPVRLEEGHHPQFRAHDPNSGLHAH